ncbi:MAG: dihydroneopterin aldolase [Bacteroidota bacterium]|nr:dihydroneopterin aldolase [Bacteroidota bacterium]
MGIIHIEGMEFFAFHGLLDEEQKIGNKFVVEIKIEADFNDAALNDDITGTVDYSKVYELVKKEMAIPSRLIEHVAKRIQNSVLNNITRIKHLEIKVIKLRPPINGIMEKVSVTLNS